MPNPKKRKTTSAKNQRRSHHALEAISLAVCEKCGSAKKPHYACPACGVYNGKDTKAKKVVAVKKAVEKKAKPAKEKKTKEAKETKKTAK